MNVPHDFIKDVNDLSDRTDDLLSLIAELAQIARGASCDLPKKSGPSRVILASASVLRIKHEIESLGLQGIRHES